MKSLIVTTDYNNQPTPDEVRSEGPAAIIRILNSIAQPIKHTDRWQLASAIMNSTPVECHPMLFDALTECYIRNRREPIDSRQARSDIEGAASSPGTQDIKRLIRLATEKGATITKEDRAIIEAFTGGVTSTTVWKKLTPEEKVAKALDESLDHAERASAFMQGKEPDTSWNRLTSFSSMQRSVKDHGSPLENAYSKRQNIETIEGDAFIYEEAIIVPMRNAWFRDEVSGYQTITNERKLFQKGQPTIGQFALIGVVEDASVVLVCEGWATAQALNKATGFPVAAALSLNNMLPVAASLLNGEVTADGDALARRVLICADTGHDDKMQEIVDGLRDYWTRSCAKWCKPSSEKDNYDFLDFFNDAGCDAVKEAITNALRSDTDPGTPEVNKGFVRSLPELMKNNKPAKALIKGIISEKSLSSLTGATMSGKSFVAVMIAFCIATGLAFHGRKTRQANVLYVAGEGNYGLIARFKALMITFELDELPANLFVTSGPVDLLSPNSVSTISTFIEEHDIELVIVDTFARSFGADENSAKDMGAAIQAITTQFMGKGSAVLLVHHTGHGDQSRARGSSSFRAALDIEIGVERTNTGLKLKCWKAKDSEPWPDEFYNLTSVNTGIFDEDNVETTSLVLEVDNSPKIQVKFSPSETEVINALKAFGGLFDEGTARELTYKLIKVRNKGQALDRIINKLKDQGVIESIGGFYCFVKEDF